MSLIQLIAIGYVLFCLILAAAALYLFVLIIKALKKYIGSKEVREDKKIVRKSLAEILKENRIRCKMTQEFVSETHGRQPTGCVQMGKRHQRSQHIQSAGAGQSLRSDP